MDDRYAEMATEEHQHAQQLGHTEHDLSAIWEARQPLSVRVFNISLASAPPRTDTDHPAESMQPWLFPEAVTADSISVQAQEHSQKVFTAPLATDMSVSTDHR